MVLFKIAAYVPRGKCFDSNMRAGQDMTFRLITLFNGTTNHIIYGEEVDGLNGRDLNIRTLKRVDGYGFYLSGIDRYRGFGGFGLSRYF